MRWFARGKLWASREAERDDFQVQKHAASAPRERPAGRPEAPERRGSDWRPGGAHKDPRDRFKKKNRPERAWSEKDPATQRDRDKPGYAASRPHQPPREDRPWKDKARGGRPPAHRSSSDPRTSGGGWSNKPPSGGGWRDKPVGEGEAKRPWSGKPRDKSSGAQPPSQGSGEPRRSSQDNRASGGGGFSPARSRERKPWNDKPAPSSDRPWQIKPTGPRAQRKPWVGKPSGDRLWNGKPPAGAPRGDRPSAEKRPWSGNPAGGPPDHRPWSAKPSGAGDRKPWQKKPFRPRAQPKPDARERRDDEPPDRD